MNRGFLVFGHVRFTLRAYRENPNWTISWQQKRRSALAAIFSVPCILPMLPGKWGFYAAVYEREPSLRSGFSLMLAQLGFSDRL